LALIATGAAEAEQTLKQKFDSLFILASSGAVTHRDQVEPAKDSIAALGEPVVPYLIDRFSTKSARERWTVIHILRRIGSPAVPHLVSALTRPDGLIVQRVCWALGDIKDSAAVPGLVAVADHERWQVRDQAVGALGKIGEPDRGASEAVMSALADSIGQVRKSAAVACGRLEMEYVAEMLVSQLNDDFYGARFSAFEALRKMDTSVVVDIASDSLTSLGPQGYALACDLLAKFGTDPALNALYETALSELDDTRRAHAQTAIVRADPTDLCGWYHFLYEREENRLNRIKMRSARRIPDNELGEPAP
jgi:HEAT repeat protein